MLVSREGANVEKLPNVNGWRTAKPRHSVGYRVRHRVRNTLAAIVAALLVFMGSAAAATFLGVESLVQDSSTDFIDSSGHRVTNQLVDVNAGKPIEVLIIGQDTRSGGDNAAISGAQAGDAEFANHNADTTMVGQISADRKWINLVSIPRDSLVDTPQCVTPNGTVEARHNAMFNSIFANAYAVGGDLASAASCTVNAVNALTGLNIQNFVVADFQGLRDMVDAVGGVDICVPVDTKDSYTSLDLRKGLHHMDGTTATQYARMRHGTGTDGSDTMRTTRQQYLIKALLSQAMSKNILTQSDQLYQLAKAALQSLDISQGLANTSVLAGLAMSLKDMDTSRLYTQTVPVAPAPWDANRRVWTDAAEGLWAKMREGKPISAAEQAGDSGDGATGDQDGSKDTPTDGSTADGTDGTTDDGTGNAGDGTVSATPDPNTGLITDAQGRLIDPNTGGVVDPENGTIHDPNSWEYLGIADRYLTATVCAVPAKQ